jgi:hypothetical protein
LKVGAAQHEVSLALAPHLASGDNDQRSAFCAAKAFWHPDTRRNTEETMSPIANNPMTSSLLAAA